MITSEYSGNLVTVTAFGEFTLADYREFEDLVNYRIKFEGIVNLLIDLRQMTDFTLDMALEELRFARAHSHDFGRVAVIAGTPWVAWTAWLSQVFVDADVTVFDDEAAARDWLAEATA
ncbi:STAS/SEC14 domain-containing protein [Methyloversatilis universalis]|uniref:STAS/SEC14 domain-containing protein n=1 Tax=Methyloversatilis universalis TaxID=378211 RepID=UPI00037930C0|nr:STAS/SEC14 domain-containing protein [Methyloversatilis universalis]